MKPLNRQPDFKYRSGACLLGAALAVGATIWAKSEIWSCVNYLRQRADTRNWLERKIRAGEKLVVE